jgi:hypothetical protein
VGATVSKCRQRKVLRYGLELTKSTEEKKERRASATGICRRRQGANCRGEKPGPEEKENRKSLTEDRSRKLQGPSMVREASTSWGTTALTDLHKTIVLSYTLDISLLQNRRMNHLPTMASHTASQRYLSTRGGSYNVSGIVFCLTMVPGLSSVSATLSRVTTLTRQSRKKPMIIRFQHNIKVLVLTVEC